MGSRSKAKDLRNRRREERLEAIARSPIRRKKLTAGQKLDAAAKLIEETWSLHDTAKITILRRRR